MIRSVRCCCQRVGLMSAVPEAPLVLTPPPPPPPIMLMLPQRRKSLTHLGPCWSGTPPPSQWLPETHTSTEMWSAWWESDPHVRRLWWKSTKSRCWRQVLTTVWGLRTSKSSDRQTDGRQIWCDKQMLSFFLLIHRAISDVKTKMYPPLWFSIGQWISKQY